MLDALDEAEDYVAQVFRNPLPEGVFIVASVRATGDTEGIQRKGWPSAEMEHVIHIDGLSVDSMSEYLRHLGEPVLVRCADDAAFMRDVETTTLGFPLYFSFVADDLLKTALRGGDVRQVLRNTPKGFEQYISDQVGELARRKLPDENKRFLSLMTLVMAPISHDEVQEILDLGEMSFQEVLGEWEVRRWLRVTNDGDFTGTERRTYSFAHPTLSDTFAKALHRDVFAREVKQALLSYCANWSINKSSYALRYYPEHLFDAQFYGDLYEVARDTQPNSFLRAQAHAFPNDPSIPLATIRTALRAATENDDAATIAEFMLTHAYRIQETTNESPLTALCAGDLQRAWHLADLFAPEYRLLYSLLLVWQLQDEGKLSEAQDSLKRLFSQKLVKLYDWRGALYASLIAFTFAANKAYLTELLREHLDERWYLHLSRSLAAQGHYTESMAIIQERLDDALSDRDLAIYWGKWSMEHEVEVARLTRDQAQSLGKLAQAQAQAGDHATARATFEAAVKMAMSTDHSVESAQAWSGRTQTGDNAAPRARFDDRYVLTLMESLASVVASFKAEALRVIAQAQAQAGDNEGARATLEAATKILMSATHGSETSHNVVEKLREIAQAQAEAGDQAGARATFEAATRIATSLTVKIYEGEIFQAEKLKNIAQAQAQAGDLAGARATFEAATQTAMSIPRSTGGNQVVREISQAEELRKIAQAQAQVGDQAGARATFEAATKILTKIFMGFVSERDKTWAFPRIALALGEIAQAEAQAGDNEGARATFEAAIRAETTLTYERFKVEALKVIAQAQAQAQDHAGARATFEAATQTAMSITNSFQRVRALRDIAQAQAQVGDRAGARANFEAATQTAMSITDNTYKAEELRDIAQAQAQVGDHAGARANFEAAIEMVKSSNRVPKGEILRGITLARAKRGAGFNLVQTVQLTHCNPTRHPSTLTEELVRAKVLGDLKMLCIRCAYYVDASYRLCSLLAEAYPLQASAVAEKVMSFESRL